MDGFDTSEEVRATLKKNNIPIFYTITEPPRVNPGLLISSNIILEVKGENVQYYDTHPWQNETELITKLVEISVI